MKIIAGYVGEVLRHPDNENLVAAVREKVQRLCEAFPIPWALGRGVCE
jgi:glycine/serine hydroxymethyltransferase